MHWSYFLIFMSNHVCPSFTTGARKMYSLDKYDIVTKKVAI